MNVAPGPFCQDMIAQLDYETPFFLHSKARLLGKLREFKMCFPGAAIHYAMKANSEPGVLRILAEAGAGFEAASVHELHMLRRLSVEPERIIYGTSVKPIAHIREFVSYGVDRFAFDSFSELDKIAVAAPGARVYVRATVDDASSVFRFSEKFGADQKSIVALLCRARELGLRSYGISFHVGSQCTNANAWAEALAAIRPQLEVLRDAGMDIEMLNLGGGFPCAYASCETAPGLSDIAGSTLAAYKSLPHRLKLILEPGRGLIADACILVTSVIARIQRNATTWLFLDAGVYNALHEVLPFQGSTRYRVTSSRSACDAGSSVFALAGPTGDSWDVLTREIHLPTKTDVGDMLVFHAAGAYTLSISSTFNGFARPEVHFM